VARAVDAAALASMWALSLMGTNLTEVVHRSHLRSLSLVGVATVSTLVLFERRGLYHERPGLPRIDHSSRTATSVAGGAAIVTLVALIVEIHLGARELLLVLPLAVVALYVSRAYLRALRHRAAPVERVVVFGCGDEAHELTRLIAEHPDSGLRLVGVVGHRPVAERSGLGPLWLGPTERAVELMHLHDADSALVTATGFRGEQFRTISRELLAAGYDVTITTGITRLYCGRFAVKSLVHEPLVSVVPQSVAGWQRVVKRAADVTVAAVVLVLTAPILAVTALAIKLEDGGPVLFRQQRTGIGGRLFTMTKFRSMVVDAEARKAQLQECNERSGPLFKVSRDPRITRVGRVIRETSIDELPQLFDVLRGDMSLVGPRPALPEEEAQFDPELRSRFDVPPGITGLWQVEARSNASFDAYRRLDLHYVENWSLWMDLRILIATCQQILASLAVLPLGRMGGAKTGDGVEHRTDDGVVIDLRDRSAARLAASRVPDADRLGTVRD
jgi:exopolysaccharide biosynthesis polyprenyl glycosylphosphotransferase